MNFHRLAAASCWAPYLAPGSHFAKWKNKDLETKQADFKKSCIYRVPYYGCHLNVAKTHSSFLFMYSSLLNIPHKYTDISTVQHIPFQKWTPAWRMGIGASDKGPLKSCAVMDMVTKFIFPSLGFQNFCNKLLAKDQSL